MTDEEANAFVVSRGGNPNCGACAEVAFTGVTTNPHDCPEGKARSALVSIVVGPDPVRVAAAIGGIFAAVPRRTAQ